MNNSKAFTLIELIFVIVILGILSSIAIPKFFGTVEDAYISKAQAKVSAIRSGLQNYRSKELLKGNGASYPDLNGSTLFSAVADGETPGSSAGKWEYTGGKFRYHTGSGYIDFSYDKTNGKFTCDSSSPAGLCDRFE
ncbi:type IV pilin protein [Hydrogenimonas sp.]